MKERNISIDILKCFAALLITNSHMGSLYGEYSFLATGGCIGDVLFFFCSGFTLFQKPMEGVRKFPDWYKRRINRIYPTVVAIALLGCLFFHTHWDMVDIIFAKGYWFVPCIMLYYIAIFFVGSYLRARILTIGVLVALGSAVWFWFVYDTPGFSLYGHNFVRWFLFFDFMLLGAHMGSMPQAIKSRPVADAILLLSSIACFYAMFIAGIKVKSLSMLQYFSFIPLLFAMYCFYKVGASRWAEKIYKSKTGHFCIRFISGLCLEIYMVQLLLLTDKMNHLFPLNILIMFAIIFVAAYLTRCLARLISQTFKDTPYEWGKMVSLY